MATTTDHLTAVVSTWREWCVTPPLVTPPIFGAPFAEGSGHRLYALENAPSLCVRLRHRATSTVTGGFARETAAWSRAASHGLAPSVAYVASTANAVVCERINSADKTPSGEALGTLARDIHQLPAISHHLDLPQVINDYLQRMHDGKREQWRSVVAAPRTTRALLNLEQDEPRLCHNDLTPGNLLYRSNRWVAIDWEYAAMGSRYFDVAIAMASQPKTSHHALLNAVFGERVDAELLAAGQHIAQLCTQLWQQCFAADALVEPLRSPPKESAI